MFIEPGYFGESSSGFLTWGAYDCEERTTSRSNHLVLPREGGKSRALFFPVSSYVIAYGNPLGSIVTGVTSHGKWGHIPSSYIIEICVRLNLENI